MKLTKTRLKQIINEELTRVLAEQGAEQLELPGIPPANPKQYEASLATAKLILPKVLAGDEDVLVHLAYAAPRVVKGLSTPLSGIKDAATRVMMDFMEHNVDINEDIAQQVLSILKRHPSTKKIIDRIIKSMATPAVRGGAGFSGGANEYAYLSDTLRHAEYAAEEQGLEQELSYLDERDTSI